jgi:head-tail adaptor
MPRLSRTVCTLLWFAGFAIAIVWTQLVVMVVHLRRLESLAATQAGMTADWADVMRDLHANLQASSSARGRVAACNEATSTVEQWLNYSLGRSSGWRICATGGIAAGCATISLPGWVAAGCFGTALLSAGVVGWLGRRADSVARQIRGRWNGLIRSLTRSFPAETVDR